MKALKKPLLFGIKISFTTIVFYWFIKKIDPIELQLALMKSHLGHLLLYFFVTISLTVIYVYRWKMANKIFNIEVNFKDLFSIYYISQFYNQLLPGSVGGDAYRSLALALRTQRKAKSILNILFERGSALYTMLLTALLLTKILNISLPSTTLLVIELCIGLPPVVLTLFHGLLRWKPGLFKTAQLVPFVDSYEQLLQTLFHRRTFVVKFVLTTFIYQLLSNASVTILFEAFDVHASPWLVFCITSVIFPILLIPISINGFGLREGLFVMYASLLKTTPEIAISVSLLLGVFNIVLGGLGGVALLIQRNKYPNTGSLI